MRFLFVSQDFPPASGGIQTYAHEVSRRLTDRCDLFRAVVPGNPFRPAPMTWASHRRELVRLPVPPNLLVGAALPVIPLMSWRSRFDAALHAQWLTTAASIASRRLTGFPKKIVAVAHGRELVFDPSAAIRKLRPALLPLIDRFIAVSRFTAEMLEQLDVPQERIRIVPNGTDPEFFRPNDAPGLRLRLGLEKNRVLLTVCRLVSRKGVDTVLRALPAIRNVHPDVRYVVAGSGPDRSRLEALARELNLVDHVLFVGDVDPMELPSFYNLCDIFVMAARQEGADVEGFGIAFLEANACGKPVVAGRSGGTEDAVIDGETGILVPPSNPVAVSDAIVRLLDDPELRQRLGTSGRQRVVEFANWDRVSERVFEIVRSEAE